MNGDYVRAVVQWALMEDAPSGDLTTEACVDWTARVNASIIAKAPGVVAGSEFATEAFRQCGAECQILLPDGSPVINLEKIIQIDEAPAHAVLQGERVALNFLGHLSGIASATARFVEAIKGTGATILDTRKTTPGMRVAEKAAVKAGGGQNHRQGLSDGILIKENHIRAVGAISRAVQRALAAAPDTTFVEVEVTSLYELREAMDSGAKMVLLDNMDIQTMKQAVAEAGARGVITEASGNITLDNVRRVAETGVDFISSGWITHSAPNLDLSLLVEFESRVSEFDV